MHLFSQTFCTIQKPSCVFTDDEEENDLFYQFDDANVFTQEDAAILDGDIPQSGEDDVITTGVQPAVSDDVVKIKDEAEVELFRSIRKVR